MHLQHFSAQDFWLLPSWLLDVSSCSCFFGHAASGHVNQQCCTLLWRLVLIQLLPADASYYLTRNSLNYVTPVMMQDKALALSYTQIGGLTSILPVAYGTTCLALVDGY